MTAQRFDLTTLPDEHLEEAGELIAGFTLIAEMVFTEEVVQEALDEVRRIGRGVKIPLKVQEQAKKAGRPFAGAILWNWASAWFLRRLRADGQHRMADQYEADYAAVVGTFHDIIGRLERLWPAPDPEVPTWVPATRAAHYGITVEDGMLALANQAFSCAVCTVAFESPRQVRFRGFLCSSCNTALGLLKDNPRIVAGALEYLNERGHYGIEETS